MDAKTQNVTAADVVRFVAGLLVWGPALWGVGLFVWQCYQWLRTGYWPPRSVIDGLVDLGLRWAAYPTDWLGVYRALNWLPLTIGLFLLALFLVPVRAIAREVVAAPES